MPIRAPRTARMSGTESDSRSRPSKWMRAARLDAAGLGNQPHDGERRHRLAAARFADQRQRLAGGDREAHPVDHAHAAALAGKRDAQALDRQQGRAHRPSLRVRGSMMSRMASAIMLTHSTSVKSAIEAPARFHQMIGVRESSLRAWSIIWPQLPSSPMPR